MKRLFAILLLTTPAQASSVYIDQVGDGNSIYVNQYGTGDPEAILLDKGNNNNFEIIQQGQGHHAAFIGVPPSGMMGNSFVTSNSVGSDNNNFTIYQAGSGNHTAAINLDSTVSNDYNNAIISQTGAADKSFTLNLSGSNIGVTVTQDNPTTADSGSMSIQCYTGSCTGYSYTKH